jgi:hypothetical protein
MRCYPAKCSNGSENSSNGALVESGVERGTGPVVEIGRVMLANWLRRNR